MYKESWINVSNFLNMGMREPPGRGHRYLTRDASAAHVLFPFGYGLSYSTWTATVTSVHPEAISVDALQAGANVSLTVSVQNTGDVSGSRVVYVHILHLQVLSP